MSLINKMQLSVLQNIRKTQHRVFYVCSYGGCGSKMLCQYLSHFGTVKHVHSRNPPQQLTHIGTRDEWFSNQPIPTNEVSKYYVIYIYRDPIKAIQSRFHDPVHLAHIQVNPSVTLQQVIERKQDLYGIENFFDNYTYKQRNYKQRNYKIYCIKYESFFNNIEEFNRVLNINCNDKSIYPVEKTRDKPIAQNILTTLEKIYAPLKQKMATLPFITVV